MTTIIFAVEKPSFDNYQNERRWIGCSANLIDLAANNTDVQLLGENVLLISLDNNLRGLADVIQKISGLDYKYIILNEDIKLIEVPGKA